VPHDPKSAHAGSNVLRRALIRDVSNHSRGGDGPHVTDAYEPRQVREEAAVSKKVCVVTESISDLPVGRTCRSRFEEGCTAKDPSLFFPDIPRYTLSNLIRQDDGPLHFCFPKLLKQENLVHGIFCREGGVSDMPFASLNVGASVHDSPALVTQNLARVKAALGAEELAQVDQVHGDEAVIIRRDRPVFPDDSPPADALITDVPGWGLMVKLADCQGVILYDPEKNVVAVVHCGWRGNVRNILGKTVRRMEQDFSCRPAAVRAAIGPSLGPCCGEFRGHDGYFPEGFRRFQVREDYFDLWAISCRQLIEAGVAGDHIEVSGVCTRCRTDLFYSYRKEGKTGRFAVTAMLKP